MEINYFITDVFTDSLFGGAQIAVVPRAEILTIQQMQCIACELNLSETVFITDIDHSSNCCQLRIFSPSTELEFGCHTCLAAAFVLTESKILKLDGDRCHLQFMLSNATVGVDVNCLQGHFVSALISLETEPVVDDYVPSNQALAKMLNLDVADIGHKDCHTLLVANKGLYLVVPVNSLQAILDASFNLQAWDKSSAPMGQAQALLLFTSETESEKADYHLRLLGAGIAQYEHPPVGASIPAFSAYLAVYPHLSGGRDYQYTAERGMQNKRQSLLAVNMQADNVQVQAQMPSELTLQIGGQAVMAAKGQLYLSS